MVHDVLQIHGGLRGLWRRLHLSTHFCCEHTHLYALLTSLPSMHISVTSFRRRCFFFIRFVFHRTLNAGSMPWSSRACSGRQPPCSEHRQTGFRSQSAGVSSQAASSMHPCRTMRCPWGVRPTAGQAPKRRTQAHPHAPKCLCCVLLTQGSSSFSNQACLVHGVRDVGQEDGQVGDVFLAARHHDHPVRRRLGIAGMRCAQHLWQCAGVVPET